MEVELIPKLNEEISNHGLVDLHTHLIGMGSADFWVSKVIEAYIPLRVLKLGETEDVFYPMDSLLIASGLKQGDGEYNDSIARSKLETRMFDGLSIPAAERFKNHPDKGRGLYNSDLVRFLLMDNASRAGNLRSVVRNWFEFLGPSGEAPQQVDILDTCE